MATHGGNNQNVKIILQPEDSTKTTEKINMLFYPKFSPENNIIAMDGMSMLGFGPRTISSAKEIAKKYNSSNE